MNSASSIAAASTYPISGSTGAFVSAVVAVSFSLTINLDAKYVRPRILGKVTRTMEGKT